MAEESSRSAEERRLKEDWPSVLMLAIIMVSLSVIFLVGMGVMVNKDRFESADIVAVLSPALAAVGTVAAGVFGYSLGTRGTAEAQRTAARTAEDALAARQEAAALAESAAPLILNVERVADQARKGDESAPGKRHVSVDDLNTLSEAARWLETRREKRLR